MILNSVFDKYVVSPLLVVQIAYCQVVNTCRPVLRAKYIMLQTEIIPKQQGVTATKYAVSDYFHGTQNVNT